MLFSLFLYMMIRICAETGFNRIVSILIGPGEPMDSGGISLLASTHIKSGASLQTPPAYRREDGAGSSHPEILPAGISIAESGLKELKNGRGAVSNGTSPGGGLSMLHLLAGTPGFRDERGNRRRA